MSQHEEAPEIQLVVKRFQALMKQNGLTAYELSMRSGVDQSVISRILKKGRREFTVITLLKLIDGLDITPAAFFDGWDRGAV